MEQFYAKAAKDPALQAKLVEGAKSPQDFLRNIVETARSQGYQFTAEEAGAWVEKNHPVKAGGELSDSQLEAVAGGKGGSPAAVVHKAAPPPPPPPAAHVTATAAATTAQLDSIYQMMQGIQQQMQGISNSMTHGPG
jgi:predicted ribosomally synthesized peptide with nif11-like leader